LKLRGWEVVDMSGQSYTIATVVKVLAGYAWFERMKVGVEKFGRDTGHRTSVLGPEKADEYLQARIVNDLVQQGVDAICIVPVFPQAVELSLNKARHKGIVVISHEAARLRNADYALEPFDNAEYGMRLMDRLAEYLGEEGDFAMLVGTLTGESHKAWTQAALTRQSSRYPNMRMRSRKLEDHDDQQVAYEQIRSLLKTYPGIRGIIGCAMSSVPGAARAVEEAGLGGSVRIVGTSLPSVNKKYLQNGIVNQVSFWDPADAGYAMNTLAVRVLEGKAIHDEMDLGVPGYTKLKMDEKILYGSAWIDVTKENMMKYTL
jgi:simple sugar transport system substrate-binding protein